MKANKILSSALLALLLLSSCASDDLTPTTAPIGNGKGNIHFTLGGSAKAAASRATTTNLAGEAKECAVNELLAVLFDTHKGFYGVIEATDLGGGEYDILVPDDATYDIWFVANADAELRTTLENIQPEVTAADAVDCLKDIIATQAPDGENGFLMLSAAVKRTTTTITQTEDLGEVSMSRRAARFDIVNQAEGVSVTKITFNKRPVKTTLYTSNYMPEDIDGLFEASKVYTPETPIVGNKDFDQAGEYRHEIYSYRNTSLDLDSVPTIDIEYVETVDGKEVSKMHTIRFVDPDAPAGTPLAIKSNRLYTITLTKAYKLEFNLTVADWEEGEVFNQKQLPIELPISKQDSLNRELWVYDLFAEYNTKTIDNDGNVTFFEELVCDPMKCEKESYFSMKELENKGLLYSEYTYTDKEGNVSKYRLPTYGELTLLMPSDPKVLNPDFVAETVEIDGETYDRYYTLRFRNTNRLGLDIDDNVYLKNNQDGTIKTTIEDESDGFLAKSEFLTGVNTLPVNYNIEGFYSEGGANISSYTLCSCYAVRFKGTSQCAAYKWEPKFLNDNPTQLYYSIKIKALPEKSVITAYDIVDNNAFWKNGYIEYNIPVVGALTGALNRYSLSYGYLASNSMNGNNNVYLGIYVTNACINSSLYQASASRKSVRLVKVKEAAETPAD